MNREEAFIDDVARVLKQIPGKYGTFGKIQL
jgi:hypothetical protein